MFYENDGLQRTDYIGGGQFNTPVLGASLAEQKDAGITHMDTFQSAVSKLEIARLSKANPGLGFSASPYPTSNESHDVVDSEPTSVSPTARRIFISLLAIVGLVGGGWWVSENPDKAKLLVLGAHSLAQEKVQGIGKAHTIYDQNRYKGTALGEITTRYSVSTDEAQCSPAYLHTCFHGVKIMSWRGKEVEIPVRVRVHTTGLVNVIPPNDNTDKFISMIKNAEYHLTGVRSDRQ